MSFNISMDEYSCIESHCEESHAVSEVTFGRDANSDCLCKASFLNQENGCLETTYSGCTERISLHHHLANGQSYASPSSCGSPITSESNGEIPPLPPLDCSNCF